MVRKSHELKGHCFTYKIQIMNTRFKKILVCGFLASYAMLTNYCYASDSFSNAENAFAFVVWVNLIAIFVTLVAFYQNQK